MAAVTKGGPSKTPTPSISSADSGSQVSDQSTVSSRQPRRGLRTAFTEIMLNKSSSTSPQDGDSPPDRTNTNSATYRSARDLYESLAVPTGLTNAQAGANVQTVPSNHFVPPTSMEQSDYDDDNDDRSRSLEPPTQHIAGVSPRRARETPPSSRRGDTTFYSDASIVDTIPEDAREAIPRFVPPLSPIPSTPTMADPDSRRASSWVDYEVPDTRPTSAKQPPVPDLHDSVYDADEPSLIRQASLSRRQKPKLTHVRSSSGSQPRHSAGDLPRNSAADSETLGHRTSDIMLENEEIPPIPAATQSDDSLSTVVDGRKSLANTTRSSNYSDTNLRPPPLITNPRASDFPRPRGAIPSTASDNSTVNKILIGIERSSSIRPPPAQISMKDPPSKPGRLGGGLANFRRPSKLEIPAGGRAKASNHNSETSLPELIRRATNLASNLDRSVTPSKGNRSPSRLMIEIKATEDNPFDDSHSFEPSSPRSATDISAILAAFPPPVPTSSRSRGTRIFGRRSRLGMRDDDGGSMFDEKHAAQKRYEGRRCCGIRLWIVLAFFAILTALILIAVIVPVVLSKQKQSDSGSECDSQISCSNGGFTRSVKGTCMCVCVNGYSGSSCQLQNDGQCTTADLPNFSTSRKPTIGAAIPALLTQGPDSFSIPLDSGLLLKAFNMGNTGCSTQNALVTFNGNAQGTLNRRAAKLIRRAPTPIPVPDSTGTSVVTYTQVGSNSPVTSNGLVYEGATPTPSVSSSSSSSSTDTDSGNAHAAFASSSGSGTAPTPTPTTTTSSLSSTATGSAAASSSSSGSAPASNGTTIVSAQSMEFARCAVLYVLQEISLDAAVTSQNRLQMIINNGVPSGYSDAGTGVMVDLLGFRIDMGRNNGGVVGAKPKP